jgi:hypothetical protein
MSTEPKSACCGKFTTCTRLDCPDSGPQRDALAPGKSRTGGLLAEMQESMQDTLPTAPQPTAAELARKLRDSALPYGLAPGGLNELAAAELERLSGVEKQLNTLAEWAEEKMAGLKTRVIQAESTTRSMRRALDVVEERARVAEADLAAHKRLVKKKDEALSAVSTNTSGSLSRGLWKTVDAALALTAADFAEKTESQS